MKFRVERDSLADAVLWASRSLPSKATQPLLNGLHIVADKSGLVITGSDVDASSRANVQADVAEPGTVLVPGRLLADIMRSLPAAVIEFSVDGSRASVTCGRSSFAILTMPVAEYPMTLTMPDVSGNAVGSELATAVAQVAVATARDHPLPAFTGIKADVEGGTITLAATDRYRLAVRELDWSPASPSLSTHALIPARFFAETAKALATSKSVGLAFTSTSEGLIGIQGEERQATSRLLAADFPRYQQLLPTESGIVAQVSASALSEAVKRVSLVLDREQPIKLHFSGGEVMVSAGGGSGEIAEASEYVEATLAGDDISIAFNSHYLLDGLSAIDSATAVLSMTTPAKAAVITGAAEVDGPVTDSFKYVLMPKGLS